MHGPKIKEVIEKENELIEFVIDKNLPDFSLEKFKDDYNFYSKDLCDEMEQGFISYLFVFFSDKGMQDLATTIQQGIKFRIAYDLIQDMKNALAKPLYTELVKNSFFYAPPYLVVYDFMQQTKKWPMLCLTVMEWYKENVKENMTEYIRKYCPEINSIQGLTEIKRWLEQLRES